MIAFILTVPIWDSSPAKFCIFRVLGGRKKLWCFLLGKMCKLWAGECTYSSEKLLFHHWWHIIFYQIKSSNKYVPFYLLLIIKDLQNIPKKMLKISLPNNCAWFLCKSKFIRWYGPLSFARWDEFSTHVINLGITRIWLFANPTLLISWLLLIKQEMQQDSRQDGHVLRSVVNNSFAY